MLYMALAINGGHIKYMQVQQAIVVLGLTKIISYITISYVDQIKKRNPINPP